MPFSAPGVENERYHERWVCVRRVGGSDWIRAPRAPLRGMAGCVCKYAHPTNGASRLGSSGMWNVECGMWNLG